MSQKGLALRSAPRSGPPSRLAFAHASLRSAREGGFTLLEVLLVVVVLAILASMLFGLMHFVDSSRVTVAEGRINALGLEVEKQIGLKGFPPATLATVATAIKEPGWVQDDWGNAIQYTVNGKQFKLWSFGPDGVSGTRDDILYKRN